MFQKIYEFLLYRCIDNIQVYNFLVRAFPKQERNFLDKAEKKISPIYIPEEKMEQMRVEVWKKICKQIREKHGKDAI